MKGMYKFFALAGLFFLIAGPTGDMALADMGGIKTFDMVKSRHLFNAKVHTAPSGKKYYEIADLSFQQGDGESLYDMVLSFNKPATSLMRDETGQYPLGHRGYVLSSHRGSMGGGCGYFSKGDHRIELLPEIGRAHV